MLSTEYRSIIAKIVKNLARKKFPGLKKSVLDEMAREIAVNVQARLYGASVDNVASPIWRDHICYSASFGDAQPTKTAQEILNEGNEE